MLEKTTFLLYLGETFGGYRLYETHSKNIYDTINNLSKTSLGEVLAYTQIQEESGLLKSLDIAFIDGIPSIPTENIIDMSGFIGTDEIEKYEAYLRETH